MAKLPPNVHDRMNNWIQETMGRAGEAEKQLDTFGKSLSKITLFAPISTLFPILTFPAATIKTPDAPELLPISLKWAYLRQQSEIPFRTSKNWG